MSTLQENLNAIKAEKDTKIISNNIKSGITVFGVQGDTNIIDTSFSSSSIIPTYSNVSGLNFNEETGYYECTLEDYQQSLHLEITVNLVKTANLVLNYKGSIEGAHTTNNIYLDDEIIDDELTNSDTYTDFVIENVTEGTHTVKIDFNKEFGRYELSIKMLTEGSPATSSDIATGKIAYVNGQKITGSGVILVESVSELPSNLPTHTLAVVYSESTLTGVYEYTEVPGTGEIGWVQIGKSMPVLH